MKLKRTGTRSTDAGSDGRHRGARLFASGRQRRPVPGAPRRRRAGVEETTAIAEEAYIYGLPLVMNYAAMYEFAVDRNSGQFKAPFNQIANEARVFTPDDTAVIAPNSDTPYSLVSLDLRAEPMVLSVPDVEESRYYSVQLCDGNTFNYGYIGSRATGNGRATTWWPARTGHGETPPGIRQVFRSSTQFSLAIYRTQLFGPDDMPNVQKVQAGYRVQPLSAYLGQPRRRRRRRSTSRRSTSALVKTNFFEYLAFALQFAPAGPRKRRSARDSPGSASAPGRRVSLADLLARAEGRARPAA